MRRSFLLALALAALPLPGCIFVAAGAAGYGTAQYVRNADVREYEAPFPVVWAATLASAKEAGYPVALDMEPNGTIGSFAVNDAAVSVWQVAEGRTRVRVRIGTFSTAQHRAVSGRIHGGITSKVARARH